MHCLAISLDSDSNKVLFEIGQFLCKKLNTSLIIENFHLTLICANGAMECSSFIKEFKEEEFIFKRIYPIKWVILEGKTTDYDYLALEVFIPKKIVNSINNLRNKLCQNTNYEYKPHISIIKAAKGTLPLEIIGTLNEQFPSVQELSSKNLVQFNHNFEIIKSDCLSQLLKKPVS
jgi:hypothetical protein